MFLCDTEFVQDEDVALLGFAKELYFLLVWVVVCDYVVADLEDAGNCYFGRL